MIRRTMMNRSSKLGTWVLGAACALGLGSAGADAATVELPLGQTVNGIGPLHTGDFLDNYYAGGFGSTVITNTPNVGPGPNVGFAFSQNADVQAAGHNASTGAGRFENNPSGLSQTLLFAFSTATPTDYMNFASGFSALSFNYSFASNSSAYNGQTVNIWSGANGTGTLLDSFTLSAAATTVNCTSTFDSYCTWSAASAANFGTARSVTFGSANGNSQFMEFDGVSVQPVPLPAAAWLLASGLAGLSGAALRRRQKPA